MTPNKFDTRSNEISTKIRLLMASSNQLTDLLDATAHGSSERWAIERRLESRELALELASDHFDALLTKHFADVKLEAEAAYGLL